VKPPFHLRKAIDHRSAQLEEEVVSVILLSNMRLQQQVLGYCISSLPRNNVMFGCQESHIKRIFESVYNKLIYNITAIRLLLLLDLFQQIKILVGFKLDLF
jgi:hypothetical protein